VQEVAVPRTEFPGPAGRDRDGIEMAVDQDAARAARRRDRLHVRVRGRLETEFLNRCRRGTEDGAHVRVRSGGNADELGEVLPDVLDQVHAPLRSSSFCTIAIAWSVCNATGPRPTARAPRSLRHPSSSAVSSWLSESTKVASAGRAACRISLPPSLRATNVGPRRSSASGNVAMEPYTPGENSCSIRDVSTRVCRIREAFERMSGWYDFKRKPTRRTNRGGVGGPRSNSRISQSRRMPWAERRAALAAFNRMSIRPALPARSSRGNPGSVDARWPTAKKRRTQGRTVPVLIRIRP